MRIETVKLIYFSPTGTTKIILDSVTAGLGAGRASSVDLTLPEVRKDCRLSIEEDVVIIGVPVYAQRLPHFLYDCLKNIEGRGKPVVLVCVYGNIHSGIALGELQGLCTEKGLVVAGGAKFIGEHSFCCSELALAGGRPDSKDLRLAEEFGKEIRGKLSGTDDLSALAVALPRGRLSLAARVIPPNGERLVTRQPNADISTCNRCGVCSRTCPMGAIDPETMGINEHFCTRCFSCVRKCPAGSRSIVFKKRWIVMTYLRSNSRVRKEPDIYI